MTLLAHATPSSDELIYTCHERRFALHSLRSQTVSRLYIQVDNDDKIENWTNKQAPHSSFENQLQQARFDYIAQSKVMATTIAENYVGLKDV